MSDEKPKDANTYHLFRRVSDIIVTVSLVGGIMIALFKWFYMKPVETDAQVRQLVESVAEMNNKLDNLSNQLEATNRRLTDFQKSFKLGKPGRWALKGNGWVWVEDK